MFSQSEIADLYDRLEAVEQFAKLMVESPLELIQGYNPVIRLSQPRRLFARITGLLPPEGGSGEDADSGSASGSGDEPTYCFPAYTWAALVASETCLDDNPADVQGSDDLPALCLTGREDVPTDGETIVELIQAPGWPYFVFFWGVSVGAGGGSGEGGLSGSGCSDRLPINQCDSATGTTVQKTLTAYDADGRPITFCVQ